MQNLINKEAAPRVRYCFTLSAHFIPEAVLEEDKELRRVARKSDQCFAFVERQSSWNVYQIRIAATPHRLHNDEQSYVIHVPFTALPTQMYGTTLAAEAIPGELLLEDKELQSVVQRNGTCWALVERQVDWDCYRVRIAARQSYLHDKERSHLIFVSATQLRGQEGDYQQTQCHTEKGMPSCAETQPAKERQEEMKTHAVCVSETELRSAMGTMEPLEGSPLTEKSRSGLGPKFSIQRWIDLLLFRAALIALKCQEELQETIRRVLVSRRRLGGRLIGVKEMYEEDHHLYWVVNVKVPLNWTS